MSKLMDQIELRRRELAVGRGGRLWPRPVPLEPPFIPFDPLKPLNGRNQIPRGWPVVEVPESLQFLRVRPSDDDQYSSALAEQFLISLNPSDPVAFEVVGAGGEVYIYITVAAPDAAAIQGQVQAHYSGCEVFPSEDLLKGMADRLKHARGYRLRRSHLLPLREGHRTEPYAALVGYLSTLKQGEVALFQVLFTPAIRDWGGNILKVSRDPFDAAKSAFSNLPQLPKRAEVKISKPLFAVALRLAATSSAMLERLEGSFLTQFQGEENSLIPMPEPHPPDAILSRRTYSRGMLLNAGELASLVHIPDPDLVPEALAAAEPGAPASALATQDILVPLGINHHQGREIPSGISEEWLTRHVGIFGGTGYGKTNLMKYAFAPALEQGYGMAVLDPKGDLAQGFLDLVPEHRVDDVVWFDPTDRAHPPALNVLQASNDLEDETLTAELMVGLKRLFQGNAEFGPRMEWLLRNAIRTLLASEGEKTLHDIPRFLEDEKFRETVLSTVRDRELREFWQRRNLSQTVIDPVLNRLSSFLDRPTIRYIVSQPNRIDFRQIMREGKIFIANLEKGVLQDAAYVLGSFILSRLQLAALARRPGERKLFPILVDEFHNFAGAGMDTESIETFLSEARSYRSPLVVATQYVGRLNREVIGALFGNVGTLICLHLGLLDAQPLARELGDFSAENLLDLGVGEAILRMGSARDAFNVRVPLASLGESHRMEIIALSRERYCRPRPEIEARLSGPAEEKAHNESSPNQAMLGRNTSNPCPQRQLSTDQWRMLEYLADHPDETVTAVYQALGFGVWRGNNIRKQLREQNLIVEVETRMGQGNRPAIFLIPTMLGLQVINKQPHEGGGGAVHRHFQEVVANHTRGLGYQVDKEHRLKSGGIVDVHLVRGSMNIAVEIAIHSKPQKELHNIQKCLAANYDRILMLFLDSGLLQRTRDLFIRDASDENRRKVRFLGVGSLVEELK